MKTVVTMENLQPTIISRYEKGVKVGERKLTNEALFRLFINQAPIATIFDLLSNERSGELEEFLEDVYELNIAGEQFLGAVCRGLMDRFNLNEYIDVSTLDILMDTVEDGKLTVDGLEMVIKLWLERIKPLPYRKEMTDTYSQILDCFLGQEDDEAANYIHKALVGRIYKYAKGLKQRNKIDDFVAAQFPLLDFKKKRELIEKEQSEQKVISFAPVAKNCAFVSTNKSGYVYFYDIAKSQMRVKLFDLSFEDVGHPRLLFAIQVNSKGQVKSVKLAATKAKENLSYDTVLYKYPYSNVFEDGRICWNGYHDLPIEQIPMMFLSTTNNKHLNSDISELYEKYQKRQYPENALSKLKGLTVYDWC